MFNDWGREEGGGEGVVDGWKFLLLQRSECVNVTVIDCSCSGGHHLAVLIINIGVIGKVRTMAVS